MIDWLLPYESNCYFTLKELCTSVSSRSMTRQFLVSSEGNFVERRNFCPVGYKIVQSTRSPLLNSLQSKTMYCIDHKIANMNRALIRIYKDYRSKILSECSTELFNVPTYLINSIFFAWRHWGTIELFGFLRIFGTKTTQNVSEYASTASLFYFLRRFYNEYN